jgi:hypothetical protein
MDQTKSDLALLIKELETQRRSLKSMIKAAASEGDHLIVYYQSEALSQLNSRLDVLYTFSDPLHMRKQELERQIKSINNMKFIKPQKGREKWFKDRIAKKTFELKVELKRLSEKPIKDNFIETQLIDEALFALYERRYKSFKLIIWEDEDNNTALLFKIKKNLLIITLTYTLDFGEDDFVLANRFHDPLKGMGFKFDELREMYFYTYDMTSFNDAGYLKKWLSHFLIDYCHLYGPTQTIRLTYSK